MPRCFLTMSKCHSCFAVKLGNNCAGDSEFSINQSSALAFGWVEMLQLFKTAVETQVHVS